MKHSLLYNIVSFTLANKKSDQTKVNNNLDEFFRVRVATLNRMIAIRHNKNMHLEINPKLILEEIQEIVFEQQKEFERVWNEILRELKKEKIFLISDLKLHSLYSNCIQNS